MRAALAKLVFRERAIPLAVVLVVVAVFAVGLRNHFVHWDDYPNFVDNPHFRGLGPRQLGWMFTTTLMGHYIPLTWLTFGLDYVLWGMQPAGYHFTNLVLHATNAVLVYWVAKRLLTAAHPSAGETARRAGAMVAAVFFAVHPLRAESVAWVTERRDVLSGVLFLICLLMYLRAASAEGSRRRRLLSAAVLAFALSMLAKSIVMTLPLLLIVIDWYPLRRLRTLHGSRETGRVLLEKAPFIFVGLVGAVVSYWAVGRNEFFTSTTTYPLPSRIAMALYSMHFYAVKTVLPMDLSPLYELPPRVDPLDRQFLAASIVVVVMSIGVVALARRWPAALAAYAWYAIMLAPIGGIVHAGFQLAHDRYSYLSCLSFAILVGGGIVWLVSARDTGKLRRGLFAATCAPVGALLAALAVLTWFQVQVWRDTESLWTHATFATPDCSICHDHYGGLIVSRTPTPPRPQIVALEHFYHAIALMPDRPQPYGGIGLALLQLGRPREAEAALRRALDGPRTELGVFNNLGVALNRQGRFAEALVYLRRVVEVDAHNVVARANLGEALVGAGHLDEAIAELRRATDEQPYAPEPRIAIVLAYHKARNTVEMRKHFTILRQLHPVTARDLAEKHGL